ncbi:RrF2 family transcriptional regulator [Nonomuraea sp. NPDC059023]|uniref:RrF2 family transcriptional regulator n=1 Tax=unclassified Nonomuraea TaxID=2593643 RepID=UPI0036AEED42
MTRTSARTQYALRAMVTLAAADGPLTAGRIATGQDIPRRFCDNILLQLRRGGLVISMRGPEGGYRLARPPETISLADVIVVVEGIDQDQDHFPGAAAPLAAVWSEIREHETRLLSEITLAQIVTTFRGRSTRAS